MFLTGLQALVVGNGVAGRTAGSVLADLGASASAVLTERSSDTAGAPSDRAEAVDPALDRVLPIDRDRARAQRWHVVIDDRLERGICEGETIAEASKAHVTITAFGTGDGRDSWIGSELVALAAGGAFSVVCDKNGAPARPAGWQAERSTGQIAALAALDAISLSRQRGGRCVHADVSARDAVAYTFVYLECAHTLLNCQGSSGGRRYTAPSGVFPTADGLVRLAAIDDHQWTNACKAFGNPDWAEEYRTAQDRRDRSHELNERVGQWTRSRRKADIAELMQRHGVPSTSVNAVTEVLTEPQLRVRGFFTGAPGTATHRPPWILAAGSPDAVSATFWDAPTNPSLSDFTMTEATHVVSAPIAGALIGGMGMHVRRLEDVDRLDMYRRIGPFADGAPDIENGAYFLAANLNKQSIAFDSNDLTTVAQVLDGSDIVLENVREKRLKRWGVDLASLSAAGRLTVSVSGFGRNGPLADYRAYANNIHACSGFSDATRGRSGEPAEIYSALADLATSLATAAMIAAWALGPWARTPADADIAMLEVMVSRLSEQLAAASTNASPPSTAALADDLFETRNGRQLAITIQDLRGWNETMDALGAGPDVVGGDLAARHELLRRLVRDADAEVLMHDLQGRGVACAVVAGPADLTQDEVLRRRGLFRKVPHERRGSYWSMCQPWQIVGPDERTWTGAPMLGMGTPLTTPAERDRPSQISTDIK